MQSVRKVAIIVAALASVVAGSAAQSAFAQSNRYTRIQAGTSGYLGPNGLEHRRYDRGFGGGYPGIFGGRSAPYENDGPFGGAGVFSEGY